MATPVLLGEGIKIGTSGLRSAGAATAGAAPGARAAGSGYGLGDAALGGTETGEGGHLAPGGAVATRAFAGLVRFTQGTQLLEFRIALGAEVFVDRHCFSPLLL